MLLIVCYMSSCFRNRIDMGFATQCKLHPTKNVETFSYFFLSNTVRIFIIKSNDMNRATQMMKTLFFNIKFRYFI